MTCEQTETLLAQLASGDTPGSDEEAALMNEATAHVASCDRCREKLADYRITLKLLTDAVEAEAACGLASPTLSPDRREKLIKRLQSPLTAELARTSGGVPVPDPASGGRFDIRNYLRPLGVAASFGLVALGAWGLVDALSPNYESRIRTAVARSKAPVAVLKDADGVTWTSEPMATVIDTSDGGTLIVNDSIAAPGDEIRSGEISLDAGEADFRLNSGVTVRMRGPSKVTVTGEGEIATITGDVTVDRDGDGPADGYQRLQTPRITAAQSDRNRDTGVDTLTQLNRVNKDKIAGLAAENDKLTSELAGLDAGQKSADDGWRDEGTRRGFLATEPGTDGAFAPLGGVAQGGEGGGGRGPAPIDNAPGNGRESQLSIDPAVAGRWENKPAGQIAGGATPTPTPAPVTDPAKAIADGRTAGSGLPATPDTPDANRFAYRSEFKTRATLGADVDKSGKDADERGASTGGALALLEGSKRQAEQPTTPGGRQGQEYWSLDLAKKPGGSPSIDAPPSRRPAKPAAPPVAAAPTAPGATHALGDRPISGDESAPSDRREDTTGDLAKKLPEMRKLAEQSKPADEFADTARVPLTPAEPAPRPAGEPLPDQHRNQRKELADKQTPAHERGELTEHLKSQTAADGKSQTGKDDDGTRLAELARNYEQKRLEVDELTRSLPEYANGEARKRAIASEFGGVNRDALLDAKVRDLYEAEASLKEAQLDAKLEQTERRQVASQERERKIQQLLRRAADHRKNLDYEKANETLDQLLFVDPNNVAGTAMKEMIDDAIVYRNHEEVEGVRSLKIAEQTNRAATIPHTELITYPPDWPQLSANRLKALQTSGGNTDADRRAAEKLKQAIPVNFEANKLENVIEYMRNVTGAPIIVDWKSLEKAGLKRDTTVTLRLTSVPADKALELILDQVGGDRDPLGYGIVDGVVAISTPEQVRKLRPNSGVATPGRDAAEPQAAEPETDNLPAASNFVAVPVNPFVMTERDRQSTFGLDTDTASYALARKYVRAGFAPPAGAVRMEEFVNAFDYNYPTQSERTFTVHAEAGDAPFGENLTLVKIGVKAKTIGRDARKPAHLVFVIDASGSMDRPDRLPLVKHSLGMLVRQLGPEDRVSIVAYGTHSIVIEEAEPASNHQGLLTSIGSIQAGGSTNMIDALGKGYEVARNHFEPGHINRVIVCSDGVANVGATDAQQMLDKVAANRRQGITLTNVGFGIGGYNDALMTDLAKKGDGNYVFVDTAAEARRLFVDNLASTLQTVAKDAKIQVEFDPARVRRYRLIGYERRDIADKDFRNDAVDAGEVGSGQSATALYEVELLGRPGDANLPDLGTVAVRYRNADTNEVEEISYRLSNDLVRQRTMKGDPRFYLAASAAEYAELLRGSEHAAGGSLERVERTMAQVAEQLPLDRNAAELLELVRRSKGLPAAP